MKSIEELSNLIDNNLTTLAEEQRDRTYFDKIIDSIRSDFDTNLIASVDKYWKKYLLIKK